MATDQTLRAVITVLDKTAAPLHAINQRFAAMTAPLRQIGDRIGHIAEEAGLKRVGEHARAALEHVRHLGHGLLELAGPIAALGAIGSIAGLAELAKSTGEFAEKLDISATKTGLSTEQIAGWHYMAGLVNVDTEKLDKGFERLNRNIAEAAQGKAKDLQAIFAHMGLQNTTTHMVGTTRALMAFAYETKRLVDSGNIQLASNMLAKAFGARQGADLIALFRGGPEAVRRAMEEAAEAGISLSASQTHAGHMFVESHKRMAASVEGLKIAIGAHLFPTLTDGAKAMTAFLDEHRVEIAASVGEAFKSLAEWLKSVDWQAFGEQARDIGRDLQWVWEKVGGLKGALILVIGLKFAPLLAEIALVGAAFVRLGVTIGLAMVTNPVGLMVIAVGTLGAAAVAIATNWGGFRDYFVKLFKDMGGTAIAFKNMVVAAFEWVGRKIKELWGGAIDWVRDKWQSLLDGLGLGNVPTVAVPGGGGGVESQAPQTYRQIPGRLPEIRPRQTPLAAVANPPMPPAEPAAAAPPPQISGEDWMNALSPGMRRAILGNAARQQSEHKVTVDFQNMPRGTNTKVEGRGEADLDLNLGYAFQ